MRIRMGAHGLNPTRLFLLSMQTRGPQFSRERGSGMRRLGQRPLLPDGVHENPETSVLKQTFGVVFLIDILDCNLF